MSNNLYSSSRSSISFQMRKLIIAFALFGFLAIGCRSNSSLIGTWGMHPALADPEYYRKDGTDEQAANSLAELAKSGNIRIHYISDSEIIFGPLKYKVDKVVGNKYYLILNEQAPKGIGYTHVRTSRTMVVVTWLDEQCLKLDSFYFVRESK